MNRPKVSKPLRIALWILVGAGAIAAWSISETSRPVVNPNPSPPVAQEDQTIAESQTLQQSATPAKAEVRDFQRTVHEPPVENAHGAELSDIEVIPGPGGSYVVRNIEPGSLYEYLGLRPGDVVHDIATLADLQFPQSLEHAARHSEFRLTVYRDGAPTLLTHR